MTASKSERLLNLVILLLVSRNFVSKEKIRETIEEYAASPSIEAFEKKFERDKEELRALGIPIEVGSLDRFFEDEQGYRISRDSFELPRLDLTPDEVAVIGLAARVWQHAGLAATTSDALLKLRAAGHDVDRELLDAVQPATPADEPALEALLRATLERRPVTFGYRRSGALEESRRHLQPWGVVSARGHWYVVGHDTDRGEPRLFRLGRITGPVDDDGRAGAFKVPDGVDVQALSRSLAPSAPEATAVILVRSGMARGLRRIAERIEPEVRPGWDRLSLRATTWDLTSMVLRFADAVVIEEPAELRADVRRRLEQLVAAGEEAR